MMNKLICDHCGTAINADKLTVLRCPSCGSSALLPPKQEIQGPHPGIAPPGSNTYVNATGSYLNTEYWTGQDWQVITGSFPTVSDILHSQAIVQPSINELNKLIRNSVGLK